MEIKVEQHNAAGELIDVIAAEIGGENREVIFGTAISACARLAGSFLLRSFDLSIEKILPGDAILSPEANEKGPDLINVVAWILNNFQVEIDNTKMQKNEVIESNLSFLESINLLQNQALEIMKKFNLSFEEMAQSAAMSTAFIILQGKNQLSIEAGFSTAIYHFIEGTKTYPPEFK